MNRIKEQYQDKIKPELQQEFGLDNPFSTPALDKISVNVGVGKILQSNPKALEEIVADMAEIVGQKPITTRAKKAVAAFKIREGQVVGVTATIRGKRMYEFFDKLVSAAMPRIRDFRGFSRKGFDGHGNYTLGLKEHIVFPEMAAKDSDFTFGVEVTITTTAKNDDQGYALLKKMGFPFND